jgi:hypothetical protein
MHYRISTPHSLNTVAIEVSSRPFSGEPNALEELRFTSLVDVASALGQILPAISKLVLISESMGVTDFTPVSKRKVKEDISLN